MTISRRDFLVSTASTAFTLALPARLFADTAIGSKATADALAAATKSPLIYISPLKKDGSESRCHGEVWFVMDGDDLLVVTSPERWRAACISKGADQARIWVGDFGPWKKSAGGFRQAPTFVAGASIEGDRAVHARALEAFGKKYSSGWAEWGPRFEKGLASGERVLLRYAAAS